MTRRACLDCPATWTGAINCPTCGAPGEPQEPRGRGQPPKPHGTARNPASGGRKWFAVLSGDEAAEVDAAQAPGESRADLLLRLVRAK